MEQEKVGLGYKIVLTFGWIVLLGGIAGLIYAILVNHVL